jgi:FtsZ-binding cell division protein ZapB
MKNSTAQKKHKNISPAPSEKTRWAYFMQAIEPKDEAINHAFPGYHPQWVAQSQAITIAGKNFHWMRHGMGLTVEQCAAYLRVNPSAVRSWETDAVPVPFTAFELLRVISNTTFCKLSHHRWDGWFIEKQNGALVSPDYRITTTPEDINTFQLVQNKLTLLESENQRLKAESAKMQAENTRLREMFVSQGVIDELATMQERIGALMTRIKTAKVYPFKTPEEHQTAKEAAA